MTLTDMTDPELQREIEEASADLKTLELNAVLNGTVQWLVREGQKRLLRAHQERIRRNPVPNGLPHILECNRKHQAGFHRTTMPRGPK